MDRKISDGTVLVGAGEQADDTGELAGAREQSAELVPLYDRVEQALGKVKPTAAALANKDRPVAAVLADLLPDSAAALVQKAQAATVSQLIGARSDISLAS